MKLPESFPESTLFLDVGGLPVTAYFHEDRYFDWEDRDAAGPRPVALEDIAGKGRPITETEFRALVHRAHTRALPALLLRAAKDLVHCQRDYAELKAQGLSEDEISVQMRDRAEKRRAEDPETLTIRTIAAARRLARKGS